MFKKDGRPGSRKQLIVFITGENDIVTGEVRSAAKKLDEMDVKVIYVKMGDVESYSDPPSTNVITESGDDTPDKLAEFIAEKSDKSKSLFLFRAVIDNCTEWHQNKCFLKAVVFVGNYHCLFHNFALSELILQPLVQRFYTPSTCMCLIDLNVSLPPRPMRCVDM